MLLRPFIVMFDVLENFQSASVAQVRARQKNTGDDNHFTCHDLFVRTLIISLSLYDLFFLIPFCISHYYLNLKLHPVLDPLLVVGVVYCTMAP